MQIWVCAVYLIIIGCVTTSLVIMLLKGKSGIHNLLYASCQSSVILWCASQILIGVCDTTFEQWIAYAVGNLGICSIGSLWLLFVISYSDNEGKLSRKWFFLFVIPFVIYVSFLTNGYHHFYYKSFGFREVVRGPLFFANITYTYACVLIGCFLLLKRTSLSDAVNVYVAKAMIVAAAIVPIILNGIQLVGLHKADYDITALGFGVSTILVLCATIRFRFMDVNMKAFDSIIYNLTDGVMLFKGEDAVYSNPAFWNLLQLDEKQFSLSEWNAFRDAALIPVKHDQEMEDMQFSDVYLLGEKDMGMKEEQGDNLPDAKHTYLAIEILPHDAKHTILVVKDVSQYFALLSANQELAVSQQKFALSKERNRIAQQVHDTTGHTLVMVQSLLKLAMMEKEKADDYLGQAQGLVKSGLKELRESINMMRRQEESYLVTQAITQLTTGVHEFAIEVTLQGEDGEKYTYLTKVIYDILRETITNCLKYANATHMEVVVRFLEDRLEMLIADNGDGCDSIQDNNGLRGIRERTEENKGTVRFISSKGEGFMTKISLPVR